MAASDLVITVQNLRSPEHAYLYLGRGTIFYLVRQSNSQIVVCQSLRSAVAAPIPLCVSGTSQALNEQTLLQDMTSLVTHFTKCSAPVSHVVLMRDKEFSHKKIDQVNMASALYVAAFAYKK